MNAQIDKLKAEMFGINVMLNTHNNLTLEARCKYLEKVAELQNEIDTLEFLHGCENWHGDSDGTVGVD